MPDDRQRSDVSSRSLGPLENQLLRALWQRGHATVRELLVESGSESAYTTIMTTLDRLFKKGLLEREHDGRAFRYRPRQSEAEHSQSAVASNLQKLLHVSSDAAVPVSFLVDAVTEHDVALLDELERAIRRKRRELRKQVR